MKIPTFFRLVLSSLSVLAWLIIPVANVPQAHAQNVCAADRPCITALYQDGNQLIIEWDGHDDYDAYNFRWSRPGKAEKQFEVAGGSNGRFTISSVRAGIAYTVKVQACEHNFLSSSDCTLWAVATYTTAAPLPTDWCIQGYVWREAVPSDHVCVTPPTRDQTAYDNSQAAARRDPNGGPYGPDTCLNGYVWREAFTSDHVCVTPATRSQAAYDNSQAAYRVAQP